MRASKLVGTIALLSIIGLIYWPVRHGAFVWDDQLCFHDSAWLRSSNWLHFVLRDFCDWTEYFRPLTVLIFVAQVRVFDTQPGPMHLVSLGLHLVDTVLVGLLAWRLVARIEDTRWRQLSSAAAMLVYGLHPALVEPVAWIGCQYELTVALFVLLGLVLNLSLRDVRARAAAVALCFFAAALCKEAAASFPLLLVLFDLLDNAREEQRLRILWQRQRYVYLAVLLAGIVYLVVRFWALGYLLAPSAGEAAPLFSRLQKVCLTFVSYWRVILWPMVGSGPIHPVDARQFASLSGRALTVDAMALAILAAGTYGCIKRNTAGIWILIVTAALLPVLNVVPLAFTESLYHERYATIAIAATCALLPSLLAPLRARTIRIALALSALTWVGLAVANVHVTIPLWTDELRLWQWALRENPHALIARDRLLYFYVTRGDLAQARELADALVQENAPCTACMLNAALAALAEQDTTRAARALDKLKDDPLLADNPRMLQNYIFLNGRLLELRGETTKAEEAYRDATALNPLDPQPQMSLAILLAKTHRESEARASAAAVLPLLAPDVRRPWNEKFERALAASREPAQ